MDGQNKALNLIIGSLAGMLVIAVFIFAVTFGINIAITPLAAGLKDIGGLSARVSVLEAEVQALKETAGDRGGQPSEDFVKVYDLPQESSHVLGKPDARLSIVVFTDFQCPYCARFHAAAQDAVAVFPNDVKFIIKNYPLGFHAQARPAAKAALAAGLQGKYFEMVRVIMENNPDNVTEEDLKAFAKQKGLDPEQYLKDLQAYDPSKAGAKPPELPPKKPELSEALYQQLAAGLGLDVEQFNKDLKDKDAEFEKQIEADMALAKKTDVRGTPTFLLNGRKTRARTPEAWKAEIEAALKK
jgi:protein-disulfide isomerase